MSKICRGVAAPRREDLQEAAELAILRAVVIRGLARRILLPRLHQLDMRLARARGTPRSRCPSRSTSICSVLVGDVEPLRDVGAVAVETVGVPDLPQIVRAVGNRRDLLPVDPAAALDVPERRQHVDAAVGHRREVALIALGAERVVDAERLRLRGAECDPHERLAVRRAELERPAVIGERRGAAEVADDRRFGDRLGHPDVERLPPLLVRVLMAAAAVVRSDVVGGRGAGWNSGIVRWRGRGAAGDTVCGAAAPGAFCAPTPPARTETTTRKSATAAPSSPCPAFIGIEDSRAAFAWRRRLVQQKRGPNGPLSTNPARILHPSPAIRPRQSFCGQTAVANARR